MQWAFAKHLRPLKVDWYVPSAVNDLHARRLPVTLRRDKDITNSRPADTSDAGLSGVGDMLGSDCKDGRYRVYCPLTRRGVTVPRKHNVIVPA